MNLEDIIKIEEEALRKIEHQSMVALTPKTVIELCELARQSIPSETPCEPASS